MGDRLKNGADAVSLAVDGGAGNGAQIFVTES